jgi:hypothetical protein
MEAIGVIAGNRKFPLEVCQAARAKGHRVVAVAIRGETALGIRNYVDSIHWVGLSQFSSIFDILRRENVKKVVMAGQISPRRLFTRQVQQDLQLKDLLEGIRDKRADTIFGEIAARFSAQGFEVMDSTVFIEDLLPSKGTLTACVPSFEVWEDVYFGFEIAKAIGRYDIGQTVAVKQKVVVAVEAFEGTDHLIRRAGRMARGGMTVVKTAKPSQDMRFDIPVVGLNTIKNLIRARAKCLAIEAGKTLFLDQKESVRLAQKSGLSIVAV